MNSTEILIIRSKQNKTLDIGYSLQKLGYSVTKITNLRHKVIDRIHHSLPKFILINTSLEEKIDSLKIIDTIQKYSCSLILYVDNIGYIGTHSDRDYESFNYLLESVIEKDLHKDLQIALYEQTVENKLEQNLQWLKTVIESMNCAVLVTDNNAFVTMMNPLAEKITGWNYECAVGKNFSTVFNLVDEETGDDIENIALQTIYTGRALPLPKNSILVSKNGEKIPVGDTISPVRDRDNQIIGSVLIFQDITQRKEAEAKLAKNAFYDSLTNLPNRVLFLDRLKQAFQRSKRRKNYCFAVFFLDLDGFKKVNDCFGHSIGDDFLIAISKRLKICLRSSDTIARFGGDEFAILLEEVRDINIATTIADRIQQTFSSPIEFSGHQTITSVSIGIVLNNGEYDEPEKLLRDADIAMYRAKQKGKAMYAVFDDNDERFS